MREILCRAGQMQLHKIDAKFQTSSPPRRPPFLPNHLVVKAQTWCIPYDQNRRRTTRPRPRAVEFLAPHPWCASSPASRASLTTRVNRSCLRVHRCRVLVRRNRRLLVPTIRRKCLWSRPKNHRQSNSALCANHSPVPMLLRRCVGTRLLSPQRPSRTFLLRPRRILRLAVRPSMSRIFPCQETCADACRIHSHADLVGHLLTIPKRLTKRWSGIFSALFVESLLQVQDTRAWKSSCLFLSRRLQASDYLRVRLRSSTAINCVLMSKMKFISMTRSTTSARMRDTSTTQWQRRMTATMATTTNVETILSTYVITWRIVTKLSSCWAEAALARYFSAWTTRQATMWPSN